MKTCSVAGCDRKVHAVGMCQRHYHRKRNAGNVDDPIPVVSPPKEITQETLKGLMHYDPETGVFTWRQRLTKGTKVGDVVGMKKAEGYIRASIGGKLHYCHRLAWLYITGAWPSGVIDHINGDKCDNRFSNLRDVTRAINLENRRNVRKDSSTGVLGVFPNKKGFQSRIRANGAPIHLGTFPTVEEAHAAYVSAKRRLHKGCTI